MKTIFFKGRFLENIILGAKVQTIRTKCIYKKDDICSINLKKQNLILIENIQVKRFSEITLCEIKKDGFNSREELKNVLIEYYPNILIEKIKLYLITFRYIPTMK